MTTTNTTTRYEIHQRVGFRGAWEYVERHDTLAQATEACAEYNAGGAPDYPGYKVVVTDVNAE